METDNLSNAIMPGATVEGVNFNGANLSGTNLSFLLSEEDETNSETICPNDQLGPCPGTWQPVQST
jgi:hypothetical protein